MGNMTEQRSQGFRRENTSKRAGIEEEGRRGLGEECWEWERAEKTVTGGQMEKQ